MDTDTLLQYINLSHLIDLVLAAEKNDQDTPTLMEALMGDSGKEFRADMLTEVNVFKNRKTWTLIPNSALLKFAK
eukprot:3979665-Ditylum_brightwellii.AAC.1